MTAGPLDLDLIVVGAGVAGLAVAHDAARAGLRVEIVEASPRTGGMLRRGEVNGIALDLGAESFATRTTAVADLIADAGLDLQIVAPTPEGASLVARGDGDGPDAHAVVRAPLPQRTVLGIPADPMAPDVVRILGAAGARRAAAETRTMIDPAATEPSLADLVAERCGPLLLSRLVDPLCRSVYSTPASELRLSRAHPAMYREFVTRGSLLEAAAAVASARRAGAAVAGIAGGMWQLAHALERAAVDRGARIRLGSPVRDLRAVSGGVEVSVDGGVLRARRVVVSTGPGAAARLLGLTAAAPAPVRVIVAGIRNAGLDSHPVGSGVIVAADVPSAAKALTHVTAKWEWAAGAQPAGDHIVRLSARDAAAEGLATASDIAREVTLLTGVGVQPSEVTAITEAVWTDAVAGAPIDPARRDALARDGVVLTGTVVAGTGLASVIPHARLLARTLVDDLTVASGSTRPDTPDR